ncbi:MAG TPA: hypothetical protein VM759_10600 [Longimicrobium sp.]|nr:hypothetical protein [Longimicrobium sp.]
MRIITGIGTATALLLAACGGEKKSAATLRADLCENLGKLAQTLSTMPPVTASTPVSEVRKARERVQKDVQAVIKDADKLRDQHAEEMRAAYRRLDETVKAVPGDATMGEAAAAIQPNLVELERIRSTLYNGRCVTTTGVPVDPAKARTAAV